MNYKEIKAEEIQSNAFQMIGSDWMLVGAEKDGKFNAMTASWGGVGILWGRPVAFVFIRPQRYTYEFVEAGNKMTLSFFGGGQRDALRLMGSKSGRDCDKIAEAGLTVTATGDGFSSFEEAEVILECRKIYANMIDPESMIDSDIMSNYKNGDYHKMYICEIERVLVKC